MEFLWLASRSGNTTLPVQRKNIRILDFVDLPAMLFAGTPTGALIIEIDSQSDCEAALSLLDRAHELPPVWIFEPAATAASSIIWMKAGAAHVATRQGEIEDLIEESCDVSDDRTFGRSSLIGRSLAIRSIEADIQLIANRRCNLLIEGETGTGKEVVARETHKLGGRSRGPWVAVNCSAIPEALLEAELFGHVKGAFTGAVQSRAGKFETANHGTIFLDEIGDMPLATQAKLLRVLQEREIERLGGNERIKLDVRVIAATNANLADRVRSGLFRQDLYYRLNVFRILLPPLRDRTEDIPLLAQHFVEKICASERCTGKVIDRSAMDRLRHHSWPGNVRELENVIEAAVIVSGNRRTIFPSDLRLGNVATAPATHNRPSQIALPAEGLDYQKALEEFELGILTQALTRAGGNKTAAADLLGLKRTTLAAKMRVLESRLPRLVA